MILKVAQLCPFITTQILETKTEEQGEKVLVDKSSISNLVKKLFKQKTCNNKNINKIKNREI